MELYRNGKKIERRPEDQTRPTQFGPSHVGNPFVPTTIGRVPPPEPREEVIRRTPDSEPVNAFRYGLAETDAGLTGMADLIARGADWVVGDDPVTGIDNPYLQRFTPQASAERRESFYGVPPGYEPSGAFEGLINVGTQGAASTAASGGGLGVFRAIPGAVRGGGLRAYRRGLTDDYARNAAGLLAANTAGTAASEGLRHAEVDSLPLEIASSMALGMLGDSGARRAVRRIQGRKGSKQRRDAMSQMDDSVKPVDTPLTLSPNAPLGELVDKLKQRFRARLQDGTYTEANLVDARDRIMDILFQRSELITDAKIDEVFQTQGMQAANQLRRAKVMQDDILAELRFFADLYQEGRPVPSLYGILSGAGLDNLDLASMARLQSGGILGRELDTQNLTALDDVVERSREMIPEGATGTPLDVRGAAIEAEEAARAAANAPYQSSGGQLSRVAQILSGDGVIDPNALRVDPDRFMGVLERVRRDEQFGGAYSRLLRPVYREIEEAFKADGFLDEGGKMSLVNFEQLRSRLQGLANANSTDPQLAAFIGPLIKKMDKMVERRLKERSRALHDELLSIRSAYSETMDNYAKSAPQVIESSTDVARKMKSDVARILTTPQSSGDEAASLLSTARRLDQAAGNYGVKEVAKQVRVVMNDDPSRLAEVEASILNRILEGASNPDSTARRITKAQEMVEGPSFSQDEGRMMALYRELAGDEKADLIPDLLRVARAARSDPTFKGGQAFTTMTNVGVRQQAAEKAIEGAELAADAATGLGIPTIFRMIRYGMGRFDPDVDERRIQAATLSVQKDPNVLLELLQAPSKKVYEEWQNSFAPRAARTGAREGGKASGRKNQKD